MDQVLKASEEKIQRRYELRAEGFDLEKILKRAAELLEVSQEEIKGGGRYSRIVEARSLVSYWAVREIGMEGTEVARALGGTQPAVSQAVARGARREGEKIFPRESSSLFANGRPPFFVSLAKGSLCRTQKGGLTYEQKDLSVFVLYAFLLSIDVDRRGGGYPTVYPYGYGGRTRGWQSNQQPCRDQVPFRLHRSVHGRQESDPQG